jgi:hypothetical protein
MNTKQVSIRLFGPHFPKGALIITSLLWLLSGSMDGPQDYSSPKRVLALYTSHKDYPIVNVLDQSIQATLKTHAATTLEYYVEFMDLTRFTGEHQDRVLHDFLAQKYSDRKIDLIIALVNLR